MCERKDCLLYKVLLQPVISCRSVCKFSQKKEFSRLRAERAYFLGNSTFFVQSRFLGQNLLCVYVQGEN